MSQLRIGIDTGGTFTDVVAHNEITGELTVTKTPTTPADPADGFIAGLTKVLGLAGDDPAAIAAVSHGTTIATNQLLEGKVGRLGFITTEGFEFILEIARQSVPDGYGNSYFWVKPDRIVPADLVRTVRGRPDPPRAEPRGAGRGGGDPPADHDRAERAGRRSTRSGADRAGGGRRAGAHLRRRRDLHRRVRRQRGRARPDDGGQGRRLSVDDPDGRRGDRRGRRGRARRGVSRGGGPGRGGGGG